MLKYIATNQFGPSNLAASEVLTILEFVREGTFKAKSTTQFYKEFKNKINTSSSSISKPRYKETYMMF